MAGFVGDTDPKTMTDEALAEEVELLHADWASPYTPAELAVFAEHKRRKLVKS